MEFRRKKLPKEEAEKFLKVEVSQVKPYTLLETPFYLFLPANEKYVSVKGPLDYFTEVELKKFQTSQFFFVPAVRSACADFTLVGERVRDVLTKVSPLYSRGGRNIRMPPYEVSDIVLRLLGPLWWEYPREGLAVEPFFINFFAEGFFGSLPQKELTTVHMKGMEIFDEAIFMSSWVSFLALHLGYCNLRFLTQLRSAVVEKVWSRDTSLSLPDEIQELYRLCSEELKVTSAQKIVAKIFSHSKKGVVCQKLWGRFERIQEDRLFSSSKLNADPPTVFGSEGFLDV